MTPPGVILGKDRAIKGSGSAGNIGSADRKNDNVEPGLKDLKEDFKEKIDDSGRSQI